MPTIRATIFRFCFSSCYEDEFSSTRFEDHRVAKRVMLQIFLAEYRRYFKSIRVVQSELGTDISRSNAGLLFTPIRTRSETVSFTCWLSTIPSDFSTTFEVDAADFEQSLPLLINSVKQPEENLQSIVKSIRNLLLGNIQSQYASHPAGSLMPPRKSVFPSSTKQVEVKFDKRWRVSGLLYKKEAVFTAILWNIQKTYPTTAMEVIRSIFPEARLGCIRAPFEKTVVFDKNVQLGGRFDSRPFAMVLESAAGLPSMVGMGAFAPCSSIRIASSRKSVLGRGQIFCIFITGSLMASFKTFSHFFKNATISIPMSRRQLGSASLPMNVLIPLSFSELSFPNFIDCSDCDSLPGEF